MEFKRKDIITIKSNNEVLCIAEVQNQSPNAVCLRLDTVVKPQWIPKSVISIINKNTIPVGEYHSERISYIVNVSEWYKNKNEYLFKNNENENK